MNTKQFPVYTIPALQLKRENSTGFTVILRVADFIPRVSDHDLPHSQKQSKYFGKICDTFSSFVVESSNANPVWFDTVWDMNAVEFTLLETVMLNDIPCLLQLQTDEQFNLKCDSQKFNELQLKYYDSPLVVGDQLITVTIVYNH